MKTTTSKLLSSIVLLVSIASVISTARSQTTVWAELEPQVRVGKKFHATRFYPSNGDTVFAKAKRLFQSTNAGKIWTVSQQDSDIVGFGRAKNGELFLASPKGLYHSTNNGLDWFSAVTSIPQGPTSLYVNAINNGKTEVLLGTSTGLYYGTVDTSLQANWENRLPVPNPREIMRVDDTMLFARFDNGVYKSVDNGVNWAQVSPTSSGKITGFAAVPHRGAFIMVNNPGGSSSIIHSVDFGKTWEGPLELTQSFTTYNVMATNDSGVIYICGNTLDDTLHIIPNGFVYRLTKESFGWEPYSGGLPKENDITGLGFDANNRVYASTDSVGVYWIGGPHVSVRQQPSSNDLISEWYPNPTRSLASINITTEHSLTATLSIYNIIGTSALPSREVALHEGNNQVQFDLSSLSTGRYICKIDLGGESIARTIVISK